MSDRVVIGISTLYQHGKTQVPSEVRKQLGLKDGDKVYWCQDSSGKVMMEKAPKPIKTRY